MDASRLTPKPLDGEKKQRAVKDAKDMAESVRRICERNNIKTPPYDFVELIGKGTSGRVYKAKDLITGQLVAIKIMNTDDIDYAQAAADKDATIQDFRKEITALQQLKDSNARNINVIKEAFDLQEQLWIVSEYCTGGSVRTLMRASPTTHPGLEEQYIIPIARELALAVKGVHDTQRIHRDIKCTNVYITEEGEIQLGDFGIVGVTDSPESKRRTVVGTPHWMSRELLTQSEDGEGYGKEVDIWSYGCTVYEMATGNPPNATIRQGNLHTVLTKAPRLEGGDYSQELRDFIAFCLDTDPQARPTADAVLKHSYLANTSKRFPAKSLVELIHRYKAWEYGGGVRASLFMPGGAPAPAGEEERNLTDDGDFDDWNFSTSDGFNEDFEKRYSQMFAGDGAHSLRIDTSTGADLPPILTRDLTPLEKAHREMSASRGERSLGRLWDPQAAPYELHTPIDNDRSVSDLPLRDFPTGQTRESVIDLDAGMESGVPSFNFDFADQTIKPGRLPSFSQDEEEEDDYQYSRPEEDQTKRATMEWTFPTISRATIETAKRATMDWKFPAAEPAEPKEPDLGMNLPTIGEAGELPPGFRPQLKHTATVPLGQFRDFIHAAPTAPAMSGSPTRDSIVSMIDLDLGSADSIEMRRPGTASSNADSIMTDMTSNNPFFLEEDPQQREIDRNRFSSHKQYHSEGGQFKRSSARSIPLHSRGNSLSSTESDAHRQYLESEGIPAYDYGYDSLSDPQQRVNGNHSFDSIRSSTITNYHHNSGYNDIRSWTDSLEDEDVVADPHPRMNGHRYPRSHQQSSMSSVSILEPDEIEYPRILAPHPGALMEDAKMETVIDELNRMLEDFGEALKVTSRAIQQRADVYIEDGDDAMGSGNDGSGGLTTGEDDTF